MKKQYTVKASKGINKAIKADIDTNNAIYNSIGNAEPMMYEIDAEKVLFDFKPYGKYDMSVCGEDLIIKEGRSPGYYTVLPNAFDSQILNDYADEDEMINQMLEDGMTEFEILMDYIDTESIDADDFDIYFSLDRENIDTLLELIQYEARRCGWE